MELQYPITSPFYRHFAPMELFFYFLTFSRFSRSHVRKNGYFCTLMSDHEKSLLIHQIELALDDVRPHLAVDGGDVMVVELTDEMTLKVRWMGACETCSMSAMTMRAGIEQTVKSRLPQIQSVVAVNSLHA